MPNKSQPKDHQQIGKEPEIIDKNRKRFFSPFEQWEGYVELPRYIDAKNFSIYWEEAQKEEIKGEHHLFGIWRSRYHLALNWKIEGLDTAVLTKEGTDIPDMRLITWYMEITQPLIISMLNLKK